MAKLKFTDVLTETFLKQRYIEERQSTTSIAIELGIEVASVRNYLIRFNIPRRSSIEGRQTYIDCSGFEELSTDWYAYWTGFIAADGCVYVNGRKNEQRMQIGLHISEADHLRNLQQGLNKDTPIHLYPRKQHPAAKITFHNSNLIQALAKWGIVPNKTLTMSWPANLPSIAIPAYTRGYFDGDGTIYQRYRSQPGTTWTETVCRFISGSVPFLEGLKRELAIRGIHTNQIYRNQTSNAFVLPVSSRRENLLAFAHLIYTDCTICLERKRAIFREMEAYHTDHPRKGAHLRYQVW